MSLLDNWLLFLCFLQNEVSVLGLRLEQVLVPETGTFGASTTLGCDFSLDSDQLLSVKWYKDEHEFFSYSPQRSPAVQQFQVPGIFVQSNSTMSRITVVNLTLESGGNYKCEVSAERPSYRTLSQEGNLTIIVPPDPELPRLSNIPSKVRMGDIISGNCTSFRSRPSAVLHYYINNHKAGRGDVIEYSPIVGTWERRGQVMQLYTSVLGLKLTIGNQHFRQGIIQIRCTALVGQSTKPRSTEVIIKHQNFPEDFTGVGYTQAPNSSKTVQAKSVLLVVPVFGLITLLRNFLAV